MRRLQKRFASTLRTEERSLELDEKDIVESAHAWLLERADLHLNGDVDGVVERLGLAMMRPPQFEVPAEQEEEFPEDAEVQARQMEEIRGDLQEEEDPGERSAKYIVVNVNRQCKRLHKVEGGCWMGKSRIFKSASEYDARPDETEYTHICRVCWPRAKEVEGASVSSGDSSSSSTSSSSSEEEAED